MIKYRKKKLHSKITLRIKKKVSFLFGLKTKPKKDHKLKTMHNVFCTNLNLNYFIRENKMKSLNLSKYFFRLLIKLL